MIFVYMDANISCKPKKDIEDHHEKSGAAHNGNPASGQVHMAEADPDRYKGNEGCVDGY